MALPMGLYWAALGVFQGYTVKFYQLMGIQSGSVQMMFLMASAPLMALIAQPFWGRVGDRMRLRNSSLIIMGALGALMMGLLSFAKDFALMMLLSCAFAFFFTGIQPMSDSIVLEELQKTRGSFGPLRLMGSLGFALTNLLSGLFDGRAHLVPWGTVLFLCLFLFSLPCYPATAGHQRGRERVRLRAVLAIPHMWQLLALTTSLMLAIGFFYSYYTMHFTSLPHGSMGLLGVSYFIAAFAELPFLLLSQRLYRRYGAGRLLLAAGVLLTIRFLILSLARDARVLLISQVLHGGNFIVVMVTMAMFINHSVPDEIKAGGQMLLGVVGYGLARVFGTFIGGSISRLAGGPAGGFLAMAAFCLAAVFSFGPYFLKQKPITGEKTK